MDYINATIIYFFVYAVLGWICEVVYCLLLDKKIQNRGFLYGPYCPIYGLGALIIVRILLPLSEYPFFLFLIAMVACSLLEYVTSWVMEKVFHLRWWDYSKNILNINGRICLLNSFLFGVLGVIVIYVVHPLVVKMMKGIPEPMAVMVSILIVIGVSFDFIYSTLSVLHTSQALEGLRRSFDAFKQEQKIHIDEKRDEFKKFIEGLHTMREEKSFTSAFAEKLFEELQNFDMRNKKFQCMLRNRAHMRFNALDSALSLLEAHQARKTQISSEKNKGTSKTKR